MASWSRVCRWVRHTRIMQLPAVVVEDGEERRQTMGFRTDRVDVETRDGVVVALRDVGDA